MAYRNIITMVPRINDDTEFRAWGLAISQQIAAMGWVQTADSGQVNWTTVTKSGSTNTVCGYEIWRMDDALQATAPIFLKLEYGTANPATAGSLWVQVGIATDGAGSLVGVTSTRAQVGASGTSTNQHNSLFTGDTDRLGLYLHFKDNVSSSNATRVVFVSIEREVNGNGERVGTGVYLSYSTANAGMNGNARQEYFSASAGGVGIEADLGVLIPDIGSGAAGSSVAVFPQYHAHNSLKPFGLNQFVYFHGSISALSEVEFTVYGQTRRYLCLGDTFAQGRINRGGTTIDTTVTFMARYEN